jgi:hypothetical protein
VLCLLLTFAPQEVIAAEEQGTLSKALKLRKKVLQEAYDAAIKKRMVSR